MWTADITNNPDRDFMLYIELMEDDNFRGRIEMDQTGQLIVEVYPSEAGFRISAAWLVGILTRAQKDLAPSD